VTERSSTLSLRCPANPGQAVASPVPPLLLTPREAVQALAVSPRTLWQLTHDRRIPVVRIGRLTRYRPQDLAAFAAEAAEGNGRPE
jgi:excisionase family DNA binding protein